MAYITVALLLLMVGPSWSRRMPHSGSYCSPTEVAAVVFSAMNDSLIDRISVSSWCAGSSTGGQLCVIAIELATVVPLAQ